MINVISSSRYKINRKLIKVEIEELMSHYPVPSDYSLNIVFVGRKKMKDIAKKYKPSKSEAEDKSVAHPVLSFSYMNEPLTEEKTLGEVFICYPQAILLAAEREKKVDVVINMLVKHGVENILQ